MKRLLLILICLCFLPFSVMAEDSDLDTNPYKVDISVPTQSEQDRDHAMKEGLSQLIEKMSDDETILNSDVIGNLESPTNYVQEYSYEAVPNSTAYTLHVTYDQTALKTLMKRAKNSGTSSQPLIMTWMLLTKKDGSNIIISDETPGNLLQFTKQDAKKFGLSVMFPVMDMVDTALVSAADVQNFSVSLLKQIGRRYAANAHLIGTINETDNGFESKWQLAFKGRTLKWNFTADNPEEVIDDVLNEINQTWTGRPSAYSEDDEANKTSEVLHTWLKLTITNVTEREDLRALTSYLQHVKGVVQFELQEVSGDVVHISLLMRGSVNNFEQNVAANQRMLLQGGNENMNRLVYQWMH